VGRTTIWKDTKKSGSKRETYLDYLKAEVANAREPTWKFV
jgi:hypothetical protein